MKRVYYNEGKTVDSLDFGINEKGKESDSPDFYYESHTSQL